MDPKVSIAAVTYRNLDQTRKFVESVYDTASLPFELVMVDNGCPPELSGFLQSMSERTDNFRVLKNKTNQGIGRAMGRAMKECRTPYIFRSDTDVRLLSRGWDQTMCSYVDRFPEVGAVGTSITGGKFIPRRGATLTSNQMSENGGYIETDICMSNFMLIPLRTIHAIQKQMSVDLPRVQKVITEAVNSGRSKYDGYFRHLGGLLNYIHNHAGYWCSEIFYGSDDFWYSMMIRYAGLRITRDPSVRIEHKDESLRPDWKEDRNHYVSEGFQVHRLTWEVLQDFDQVTDMWDCFPLNRRYVSDAYRMERP
jgi:glycosyltransferase involved in cell wall biosynthesis